MNGSFGALFGDAGLFALEGRNTLSASESASASLPELIFSGPDVSTKFKERVNERRRKTLYWEHIGMTINLYLPDESRSFDSLLCNTATTSLK